MSAENIICHLFQPGLYVSSSLSSFFDFAVILTVRLKSAKVILFLNGKARLERGGNVSIVNIEGLTFSDVATILNVMSYVYLSQKPMFS